MEKKNRVLIFTLFVVLSVLSLYLFGFVIFSPDWLLIITDFIFWILIIFYFLIINEMLNWIKEGKRSELADLVVLNSNPLDNIRNTTDIRYVVKNGLLYDAETLDMIWPYEKKLPPLYWSDREPVPDKK